MPAPVVALAAAKPVAESVQGVVKVLSTDLVTFEGRVYRQLKIREPRTDAQGRLTFTKTGRMRMRTVKRLEPIDVSLHANPIGFGVLAITGAVAAMALFGRVVLPGQSASFGPFSVSIPQTELYKGPLADEFETFKEAWKVNKDRKEEERQRKASETCAALQAQYNAAMAAWERQAIRDRARERGCAWAA